MKLGECHHMSESFTYILDSIAVVCLRNQWILPLTLFSHRIKFRESSNACLKTAVLVLVLSLVKHQFYLNVINLLLFKFSNCTKFFLNVTYRI